MEESRRENDFLSIFVSTFRFGHSQKENPVVLAVLEKFDKENLADKTELVHPLNLRYSTLQKFPASNSRNPGA